MHAFICTTCGTQYAPSPSAPEICAICRDDRQYVAATGQNWTTPDQLAASHLIAIRKEAGVLGLGISPAFAINQRALLVRTDAGNVLWDCISLVDDAIVEIIRALGGLKAIAISHPHYYAACVDWSHAFGQVPIYLHAADRDWIMRPDPAISLWRGDVLDLLPGLTLIRAGGHFPGGTIMHWEPGPDSQGALFSGDILQVVADRAHIGFMRSYPNFIPLGAQAVRRIAGRVAPWRFNAIYGAFWHHVITNDAKTAFERSVERHLFWLDQDAE